MRGVDQANQFRTVFTIHFRRNLKKFLSGVFWCLDLIVINSYKFYLIINDSKTTETDNRDTSQHRNYIEDLVNLLFCMNSAEIASTITEKFYSKYQFQSHQTGRKLGSKTNNRVQNSINQSPLPLKTLEPLYEHLWRPSHISTISSHSIRRTTSSQENTNRTPSTSSWPEGGWTRKERHTCHTRRCHRGSWTHTTFVQTKRLSAKT